MANLLQETTEFLTTHNKSPDDVRSVGSIDGKYVIELLRFTQIADIEYDDSYGSQEIASDLVVVGDDWWLERHEYDGSEHWEFKDLPVKQPITSTFAHIVSVYGNTIEELQDKPEKRLVR